MLEFLYLNFSLSLSFVYVCMCVFKNILRGKKEKEYSEEPWLVWLSGLSTGLQTKGLLV